MIYAFDINKLDVVCKNVKRIILTDSVKYHTAKFKFSEDWEHFSKTVYFINKSNDKDEKDISVPMFLGENETVCLIPWEVLTREGQLVVSIQGVQDDTEIWTKMNRPIILEKSDKDSDTMPQEPTIPIYNQLLNKLDSKGDSIQFEDDTLSLKSGDKVLSTVRIKDETKDYESLLNIPTLNNIEIKGNKTANDYNIGNGLKVDEAKVTYKGEEISFKDFIAQYLKDNENVDFNNLENLPITPVLTDSIELTTLSDSFYIVNIESCNILVSKETKVTFTKGVIACKSDTSFSYWDNEGMHFISNFYNDAEWINNYTPIRTEMDEELEKKQDKLVSGTNIKTINHKSILSRGNIDLSTSWDILKNESISEDTEYYTLSNLGIGEYYIWLSKETSINTGVQGSLTVDLFGTNITLGNLETDSKNVLLHIIKQSNDYALLDWSTITPNTTFALSSDRNFGLFPTPVTNNSVTIRTSMGNFSSGTQIKIWSKG